MGTPSFDELMQNGVTVGDSADSPPIDKSNPQQEPSFDQVMGEQPIETEFEATPDNVEIERKPNFTQYLADRAKEIGIDDGLFGVLVKSGKELHRIGTQEDFTPTNGEGFTSSEFLANKAKEGAASLLALPGGAPVDIVHGLIEYADNLITDDPFEPSPYGIQGQKEAFMTMLQGESGQTTDNDALRYAGGVAEFAGGGLIPGAAIVAKSPTLAGKAYTAGVELASTVLGGLGLEGGGDVSASAFGEDYRGVGELAGGLTGSIVPYAVPTALGPLYGRLRAFFDPATQTAIGKQDAARLVQEELSKVPDALDNLKRSMELRENIPGYSPSLGMETNATGIQSLEKRFAEASEAGLQKARAAETQSLEAIKNKANEVFPQNSFDLTSLPGNKLVQVRTKIKNEIDSLNKQIDSIEKGIVKGNPEEIGQQLRALRNEQEILARAEKNSLYEEFYRVAEDTGVTVETTGIKGMTKKILKDEGLTFQDKSPVLREINRKYVNPPEDPNAIVSAAGEQIDNTPIDISIREFHSMMKKVNQEYFAAKGSSTKDPSLIHQLGQMKSYFAKTLDELKAPEFGGVADKLKEADNFYINEYQNVFKRGVGGRMDAYNKYGDITPDESIVSKIVMGRENGIDDFRKIYGESAESQSLLETGIVDIFARKVIKDGIYSPTAASNFMHENANIMDKLPALRNVLQNKVQGHQLAVNRQAILNAKLKATKRNKLKELSGMRDTDALIDKSMGSTQSLATLRNNVGKTPEGLEAFRTGVADHLLRQKDPLDYFLANQDKMKIAFKGSDNHFKWLKDLAEAKQNLSRKFGSKQIETSLKPQDPLSKFGTTTRELTTLTRHIYSGWISPEYAASHLTSKALFKHRQDEMNKMIEGAFYDPDIAKMLIDGVSGVKLDSEKYMFKIRDRMFSIGARANIAAQVKDDEFEE